MEARLQSGASVGPAPAPAPAAPAPFVRAPGATAAIGAPVVASINRRQEMEERRREKEERRREKDERRRDREARRASQSHGSYPEGGGGQEIKLEGGDVVVAEGEQVLDQRDESGEGERTTSCL